MKKLLAILAVALFVNLTVAQAQTAGTTAPDTQKKEVVASDAAKQCKGVSASCAKSCAGDKAQASGNTTTTLSENYVNAGSAPAADAKAAKSACAPGQSKSCCKSASKASAMTKDVKQANTSNVTSTNEADAPKK